MSKTRYFKVTTESRFRPFCGQVAIESRLDVQELEIEEKPAGWRGHLPPEPVFSVKPLGDRKRVCKKTPVSEFDTFRGRLRGLGESIWRHFSEQMFSFLLLDDFVKEFEKIAKGKE